MSRDSPTNNNKQVCSLENTLLQNLEVRPGDVSMRVINSVKYISLIISKQVQLVNLYQQTGRISEAWKVCFELEQIKPWPDSMEWYSCLVTMCAEYQVTVFYPSDLIIK